MRKHGFACAFQGLANSACGLWAKPVLQQAATGSQPGRMRPRPPALMSCLTLAAAAPATSPWELWQTPRAAPQKGPSRPPAMCCLTLAPATSTWRPWPSPHTKHQESPPRRPAMCAPNQRPPPATPLWASLGRSPCSPMWETPQADPCKRPLHRRRRFVRHSARWTQCSRSTLLRRWQGRAPCPDSPCPASASWHAPSNTSVYLHIISIMHAIADLWY